MQPEGTTEVRDESARLAPETPLTAWLRMVLVGAVCIPLTAFVVVAWWGLREAQKDAVATASRASMLAFEHAQATLAIASDIAGRTARFTAAPDDAVRLQEAALRQRLGDLAAGLPSIVNLNVWDAGGHPLVRSDQPVDPKASVADRPYFLQQQRDPALGLGVSEVIRGRQTGKELMNLTLRRPSPDGSFRGLVAVSLSPSFFREHYKALAAEDPRLASFALVRTDGVTLARWPPAPDGQPEPPPTQQTLQHVQAGDSDGTLVVPAEPGREARLVSFRRVPGYPVYVIAGFSRAAMLAEWVRFVTVLAAITLPITAGLAFVTWLALKKTRLEQATAAALREQIRRRSLAERSMLETQKLETLAVLTGGVAHDFNNLLAIVDTSLHIHRLKHPNEVDEPQLQAMSRAIRSGVRLTRQLLSFSRKQALKPETIQLQSWLPSAAELMRSTLGGQVTLECVAEPDTLPVTVDVGELELSLINLALNAKHALPDGGSFKVVARNAAAELPAAARVVICAQDDGIGIPRAMLPRVIEPFFTTREKGAGSGLGLSQVHGFCTQAGGSVTIASEEGQGTTVCMYLPASVHHKPADAPALPRAQPAPLQGRLLLVEDNEEVATATRNMLSGSGLDVVHVKSAGEALDYLASAPRPPDVVLSDIAMPGQINGIGLAFRLRDERPELPVLLTTGYAEQLNHAVSGGFEVLPKPMPPEDLLRRLRELVPGARSAGSAEP
jgi:two-component system NtrC family sensor kinase